MEFVEIIPDAIQASSGNPPAAVGAAGSDPVEDDTDATYITYNANAQWIRVSYADLVLDANKRIWGIRNYSREYVTSGTTAFYSRIGDNTVTKLTFLPGVAGAFPLNTWSQVYSPWYYKDWANAEWTQAQIAALHTYHEVGLAAGVLRLGKLRITIGLVTQPVAAVISPVNGSGSVSLAPLIQWSYTGFGEPQYKYQVKVFTAAVAEAAGFDPAVAATVYDSGSVTSSATQQQMPAGLLALGTKYYVAVKVTKNMNFNGAAGLADYDSLWSPATSFTTNAAPVAVVTTPVDPTNNSTTPTITWTYTDADSTPQTSYQTRVFTAAQYGIGGFDPATSPATWDSGEVVDPLGTVRSVVIGVPIANATYRAYVRVKDGDGNYSAWAFKQWVQNVTPPSTPILFAEQIAGSSDVRLTIAQGGGGVLPGFYKLQRLEADGVLNDVRGASYQALPFGDKIWDDFNRADNAAALGNAVVGGAWTASVGVWGINGNRAYTAAATAKAAATIDTGIADVVLGVDIAVGPGGLTSAGLVFRFFDANNYWTAYFSFGSIWMDKFVGGVKTSVVGPVAGAVGDNIAIIANGNQITLLRNGVALATVTDAANNNRTRHGLFMDNSNVGRLDNFHCSTLSTHQIIDREATPRPIIGQTYTQTYSLTVYGQLAGDVAASNPAVQNFTLDVRKVFLKLPKLYAVTDDYTRNVSFPAEGVTLPKQVNKQRYMFRPLGKTLPTMVRGVNEGKSFHIDFVVETRAVYEKMRWLLDRNVTLVLITSKSRQYIDVTAWTEEEFLWDEMHSEPPLWRFGIDFQEVSKPA